MHLTDATIREAAFVAAWEDTFGRKPPTRLRKLAMQGWRYESVFDGRGFIVGHARALLAASRSGTRTDEETEPEDKGVGRG